MAELLPGIPTLLILAVLVAIFLWIERQRKSGRTALWVAGWGLYFLHALLDLWRPASPAAASAVLAIDYSAWQLAGIAFVISVSKVSEVPRLRWPVAATMGLPALAYALGLAFHVTSPWLFAFSITVALVGAAAWRLVLEGRPDAFSLFATGALLVLWGTSVTRIFQGALMDAFYIALTTVYAFAGLMFIRRYRRLSPGVFTTALGFFTWAALYPMSRWWLQWTANPLVQHDVWQFPKYLVATGMIVILLEDESRAARDAGLRERNFSLQMQRFASLTTRLLSGADARALCPEIAAAIREVTTFDRVLILVAEEDRRFTVAGSANLSPEALDDLTARAAKLTPAIMDDHCARGRLVGSNSYRTRRCVENDAAVAATREYAANPFWETGDELLVPLRSQRGALVGCISLDEPAEPERVTAQELHALEMLAGDLAAALENARLQRQLVQSEKLAGLGQLVAGVAHELNNPLTAVLGYSEILADRAEDESTRRELSIVVREAARMKRTIQNLVRFAQQARSEARRVELPPLLDEVLSLRAYEGRTRNVEIVTEIEPGLPAVAVDTEELKQLLFNVFNNALDVVQSSLQKKITLQVRRAGDRVMMRVFDTGPGFADLDHVFDPFFTNKKLGVGSMGLSICYGIVKQHGGDIYAYNVHPRGACVVLELPMAAEAEVKAFSAKASTGTNG
jgi:two-component system, NtrC family, sensor kinase